MSVRLKKSLAAVAVLIIMLLFVLPVNATESTPGPVAVMGFDMNANVVNRGESVTLKIKTSGSAEMVTVFYDSGTASGSLADTDEHGYKNWTVSFVPLTSQKIVVYAGKPGVIDSAVTLGIPVTVNNPVAGGAYHSGVENPDISIDSISEFSFNDIITLTVTTNKNVNNVWVNFDGDLYIQGDLLDSNLNGAADSKIWMIRFVPSSAQTVTVSANTAYKINGAVNMPYELLSLGGYTEPGTVTTEES